MYLKDLFLAACFLVFGLRSGAQDFAAQNLSFSTIGEIRLEKATGGKIALQAPEKPLALFVMLSPECPLCKNYSIVLNRLQTEWGSSVEVYGIVPGKTYSGTELGQFASDYKIRFPLLIDAEKRFSAYLKATVTPEVILVDRSGAIVYRGAIDDWMLELGKKRLQPQHHYLRDAISQHLAGAAVQVRSTIAKGCLINEF